jgi:hypothetical protein
MLSMRREKVSLAHLAELRRLQNDQRFREHGAHLPRRDFARKLGMTAVLVPLH